MVKLAVKNGIMGNWEGEIAILLFYVANYVHGRV